MPRLASAYLRCSDPRQDKSIEQQRAEIQRRADQDGFVIPPDNWFIDEGISGRSTRRRKSYQEMLRRAEAQRDAMAKGRSLGPRVERMYVWAFSRIARNMFDCLRAMAVLDDAGIDVMSLTENDSGDRSMRKLIRPILAWLAERYSEELSRNVSRGKLSQAQKGLWPYGTKPFGYEIVPAPGGQVLAVTDASRPDFETARRVFREAAERGDGTKRIAARLTAEGLAPPSEASRPRKTAPGAWRPQHVHNILRNAVYCGHVAYRGEVVHRDAHEAAVDQETFNRVWARRALKNVDRKGGRGNGMSRLANWRDGLYTPWLRCGACGGRVCIVTSTNGGKKASNYFCGTRRDVRTACPGISARVGALDAKLSEVIQEQVLAPANIATLLGQTLAALADVDGDQSAAERTHLEALIGDLDRRIRQTASQVVNGLIDEDDAKAMNVPLLAQRETARLRMAALPSRTPVCGPDEVDAERFRQAVMVAWQQRPLEERRHALDRVIDHITLTPGEVHIVYSAGRGTGVNSTAPANCGHDQSNCVIQPLFP